LYKLLLQRLRLTWKHNSNANTKDSVDNSKAHILSKHPQRGGDSQPHRQRERGGDSQPHRQREVETASHIDRERGGDSQPHRQREVEKVGHTSRHSHKKLNKTTHQ